VNRLPLALFACAALAAACVPAPVAERATTATVPGVIPTRVTAAELGRLDLDEYPDVTTSTTAPPPPTTVAPPVTVRTSPPTTAYEPPSPQGKSNRGELPPDYVVARESGGSYTAVNPSSGAGGRYQFLESTWRAVGGTGLPQDASPAEQDMRAAMLWDYGRGCSHWSACG